MVAKQCSKCGISKPLSDFYPNKRLRDGTRNSCKSCWNAAAKVYAAAHPEACKKAKEQFLQRNPDYDALRGRKYYADNREAKLAADRIFRQANSKKRAEWQRLYRMEHPARYEAGKALNWAYRSGDIRPLPCWECGAPKAEAHHASYAPDMRLVVTWLCRKHHKQLHREAKSALQATAVTVDRTGVLKSVPK